MWHCLSVNNGEEENLSIDIEVQMLMKESQPKIRGESLPVSTFTIHALTRSMLKRKVNYLVIKAEEIHNKIFVPGNLPAFKI